jgi:predicted RNA-binding Zn-ribbon protein involved in translation (DUF1610 family)
MPKLKKAASERVPLNFPQCPKCGGQMILTRIEPEQPGSDRRTFECRDCGRSESRVVQFRALTPDDARRARRRVTALYQ